MCVTVIITHIEDVSRIKDTEEEGQVFIIYSVVIIQIYV